MYEASAIISKGRLPAKFVEFQEDVLAVPDSLNAVARTFVELQEHRHHADYDLRARFTREEVTDFVATVEVSFDRWSEIRTTEVASVYLGSFLLLNEWRRPPRRGAEGDF